MSESTTIQSLCVYLDEAVGASPVPLTIRGQDYFTVRKSDYFAGKGVKVGLVLDESHQIQKLQMGSDLYLDFKTLKEGVEFGLFGLLPVHTMELDEKFDLKNGGIIRFGFLKKIFRFSSVLFCIRRVIEGLFFISGGANVKSSARTSSALLSYFGRHFWGTYEVHLVRDENNNWSLQTDCNNSKSTPINRLVATLNVNKSGVVTGIEKMYAV